MPSVHKTITLDSIKQLIDINGDVTNFKANFTVTAQNGDNFQMLVVSQNDLDSGKELQYREVNGSESGHIEADKNVYQNYYLVLKADRSIPVDVNIEFDALPLKELDYKPQQYIPPQPSISTESSSTKKPEKNGLFSYWKWIVIAAILLIGGYFLYKFYLESQKNKVLEKSSVGSPVNSPIKSPSPSVDTMNPPGRFTFGRVPTKNKYY